MKSIINFSAHKYEKLYLLASFCLIAGLLWSRFLISVSMIFYLVFAISSSGGLGTQWKRFISNKAFVAVTGIFLIYTISGLWSENIDYFLNRTRIKLPFLFLPFAFAAFPIINVKIQHYVMGFFIGCITFCSLWSIGMTVADLEYYIDIYGKGQIIPTPIHHIRFSLMVTVAITMILTLLLKRSQKDSFFYSLVIGFLFLIFYQHLLAVRSGLMTLYIVLLAFAAYIAFKKAKPSLLIGGAAFFIVLSFLATQFVPTIKNKIDYMRYSLQEFEKNENIRDLSDSRRLGSIYGGIQLTKENPIIGVGIGDIMDETNAYLALKYPQLTELELLPHNQFILSSASLGIIGLVLFCTCVFLPLIYQNAYKDFLLLSNHLVFYASFMVEHTIESQIGVALYIFVILFVLKYHQSKTQAL